MSISLNISDKLKNGLIELSMYKELGLKFVVDIDTEENYQIKLHLMDAKKHHATAVYFRYLDNMGAIPQVYIYEEKDHLTKQPDINKLHKELWSSCKIPVFMIFTETEIKIFNSMSKINVKTQNISPLETIQLTANETIKIASKIQTSFMAKMFDTGAFWSTEIAKKFSYKNSAYNSLLESLKKAREVLISKDGISEPIINSLLIKSILLKYLEERGVFADTYWDKFLTGAKSFTDISQDNNALLSLFDELSNHFNGGIFKLSDEDITYIKNTDLKHFKYFLRGDIKDGQIHFWELYSFKDLPIELISNIYELFLKNKKGIVYTPAILVNFMIDQMMPLNEPQEDFKVIDPSCGSGIFLVGAYKRLVQWWMISNDFSTPDAKTLKTIIQNNIFGVDEKAEAVELAKFSLSLALCDILSPEVIWDELHFDNLTETGNLISNDFFNILNDKKYLSRFDLVLGNPPFISSLTTPKAKEIEQRSLLRDKKRPKLPDNQLALLFLEQSFKLCKPDKHVCMIQPSAFLYNNKVEDFRSYLLEKFNAKQIVDFSGLNTSLFKRSGSGADVAVSVAFFQNKKPDMDNEVLHITVRQTFESKEKLYFDLSYYDFHWISYEEAINNKYIWKCNLVGGSRIVNIIHRFNNDKIERFSSFLKNKEKHNNWIYCTGFILGNKKKYAPHLYEHEALLAKHRNNALTEDGIDWNKTYKITEEKFEMPRVKDLFKYPLIILRKTWCKQAVLLEYVERDIAFSDSFVGIHSPLRDKKALKDIANKIKSLSKEYIFYLMATSGKTGIDKATVLLKNDIDMLPYPRNIQEIKLSKIEQYFADDTIDYMSDWIAGTQNIAIFKDTTNKQMKEYQSVYCSLLNSVYSDYHALDILETAQFIISVFYYKDKPSNYLKSSDSLDIDLDNLISQKTGENINIKRIFKLYDKNIIYIIKPKQYRFWFKSIAVRDADDTFVDLINMRY